MTTPRAMWLCFGNPTRNTGRFRECFGRRRARWETQQIDSRTCRMVKNREKIRQWEEDYGDDSDFFRIRVRGEFPRASSTQLIPSDVVAAARKYKAEVDDYAYMPIAIGVDVARFGGDESVIAVRQGPKILVLNCYRELDNMQVASRVIEQIRAFQGATTFVDSVGVGSGVADRLKSLGYPVVEVNAGAKAEDPSLYYNKGAETWTRMRDWLMAGADIPDDPTLAAQLEGREYGYTPKEQIRLERKEDMKDRGMESPDRADAIANTFAEHVHVEHYANNGPGVVRRGSYEPDFEV